MTNPKDTPDQRAAKEIASCLCIDQADGQHGNEAEKLDGQHHPSIWIVAGDEYVLVKTPRGCNAIAAIVAKAHRPAVSDDWAAKYYEDDDQPSESMTERAEEYVHKITSKFTVLNPRRNGFHKEDAVIIRDILVQYFLDFAGAMKPQGEGDE